MTLSDMILIIQYHDDPLGVWHFWQMSQLSGIYPSEYIEKLWFEISSDNIKQIDFAWNIIENIISNRKGPNTRLSLTK
jgi:hypothetical protein